MYRNDASTFVMDAPHRFPDASVESYSIQPNKRHRDTVQGIRFRFLISACLLFLMVPPSTFSQDSLVVPGRLLVKVVSPLDSWYNEICTDTLDLSYDAQAEFDWLKSKGIRSLKRLALFDSSMLTHYFVQFFDSTILIDTMKQRSLSHGLIAEAHAILRVPQGYLGCYEFTEAQNYINDPGYGNNSSWWIWNGEQYADQDMSVTEAWEFTMSDESVKTIVSGGPWCVLEEDRPKTLWRDFGGRILDGFTRPDHFFSLTQDGCQCYDCDRWDAGYNYRYWDMDGINHSHAVMRIIAGQFDTTTGGTLGIAPQSLLIPIWASYTDEILQALDFGRSLGGRIFPVSLKWYSHPEYEALYDWAVEHEILPVIAVGNTPGEELEFQTHPKALNVAANVGTYRSSVTSYGPYPTVNISSAAYETSFASASAAGVAALVLSMHPDWSLDQLREKLLEAVDPMHDALWSPDLGETQLGTGRLNAYQAIAERKSGDITEDVTWSGPIYVVDDVTIKPGVTLTINLTEAEHRANRTHVRFGSLSRTQPPQVIRPKIIVEGNLIVQGSADNKILFSRLQRNIQTGTGWIGQWGGIEVKYGGSLDMNNALIEHAWRGIVTYSDDVLIQNSILCNERSSPAITFQIYTPTANVTPTVKNCEILSTQNDGIGIAVWRGEPLIENCNIHDLGVGIHYYSWYARGECKGNTISDTRNHGILCTDDPIPFINGNTITGNQHNGISLFANRYYPLIKGNTITNNGLAGLSQTPAARTGDGIQLFKAGARLKDNTITDNNYGLHLQSFSTANGGDGVTGIGGTEAANEFDDNNVSIFSEDHGACKLGFRTANQQYGHNNVSTVDPQTSWHAQAKEHSELWLQCDTWNPNTPGLFVTSLSTIVNTPDFSSCAPSIFQYPDSEFQLAAAHLAAGYLDSALISYDSLARAQDESIVLRSLTGVQNVFHADSALIFASVIDSLLLDYAQVHQNASLNLRANIAYCQGLVATTLGNLILADSLLRYANGMLSDVGQQRNNLTQLLYLHLYRNADIMEAQNLLLEIENRFTGDSLVNIARDLYRYYVDIENGGYIAKPISATASRDPQSTAVPATFTLHQNHPNPFNPVTTIRYTVHEEATVHLLFTDVFGRKVRETQPAFQLPGDYSFTFDGSSLASGMYFCTLLDAAQSTTIRMVLLK